MMKRSFKSIIALAVTSFVGLSLVACEREKREFRPSPPTAASETNVRETTLQPGPVVPVPDAKNEYEENAYAMSEGKRLFDNYNCSGCHFHGGGGIGPPLIDDRWIYGSAPQNIYETIVEGRPNGMPAFAGKVPDDQIWQLVAYVRSMSGLTPKAASPSRSDHMQVKESEQETKPQPPKQQRAERAQ
jgi:cytochrome c oxidase cbb3-type subunit III